MSGPQLRPSVLAARALLAERLAHHKQRHAAGVPGLPICRALTDLLDELVLGLFHSASADLRLQAAAEDDFALVAHGGYGRGDVAPYSDVDLMILHASGSAAIVAPLAQRLVRDVYDSGLQLGQSVRTPEEACRLARGDATILTALAESRLLAGSAGLFERFQHAFRRLLARRSGQALAALTAARDEERAKFGETVYLLEPNVKRSRGGLRDIQLLRWVGYVCYGMQDPDGLRLLGALEEDDYQLLTQAYEFLLRLRNELHFHTGQAHDLLDRAQQVRIAAAWGYAGDAALLPVERFMREYFRLTQGVNEIATRFVKSARSPWPWRQWLAPLVSHKFEADFLVSPLSIGVNRQGAARLGNLEQVLRLCDVANQYNKPIAPTTLEAVRKAATQLSPIVTREAADRFLAVLNEPARLPELLRNLYSARVLERIIPDFEHARCLLQFNEYHKYTVDEHSLVAVERATDMRFDDGLLGDVYRRVKRKWLLHLALLLHDLGKGYPEDHSEVGLQIAGRIAQRLYLAPADAETLKFLVHKHLYMSHLAFRRDTDDDRLVVSFAVEVGSPEVLQMLYLLTAADTAAVGPGTLNAWKKQVLNDLYRRTLHHLAGDEPAESSDRYRDEVLALWPAGADAAWIKRQAAVLPAQYLRTTPPAEVVADFRELESLARQDVWVRARWLSERSAVELRVAAYEDLIPGAFHRLTGALAGQGLQTLSAEIHTLADGLIFDRFLCLDPDYSGEPPAHRLAEVQAALARALQSDAPPVFRRVWKSGAERSALELAPKPTLVRLDNSTSNRCTIIDVFAADKQGLLYAISRTLFELGLSVQVAKIGTYLDQVVDVFYVTEQHGQKVHEEGRLRTIREALLQRIEAFTQADAASE